MKSPDVLTVSASSTPSSWTFVPEKSAEYSGCPRRRRPRRREDGPAPQPAVAARAAAAPTSLMRRGALSALPLAGQGPDDSRAARSWAQVSRVATVSGGDARRRRRRRRRRRECRYGCLFAVARRREHDRDRYGARDEHRARHSAMRRPWTPMLCLAYRCWWLRQDAGGLGWGGQHVAWRCGCPIC